MDEMPDLREFIAKYGERGYYMIKAVLDASLTGARPSWATLTLKALRRG